MVKQRVEYRSGALGEKACRLCRKTNIKRLHQELVDGWICLDCCAVFITPDREQHEIRSYYTTSYGDYLANKSVSARRIRQRLKWIQRFVGTRKGQGVLEVGCADGQLLYELKQCGFRVAGIEPGTASSLIAGDKIGHENVFQGFLESYKTDKPFDLAILLHTFEHLDNPRGALAFLADLLEPDGLLLLEVPNFYSLTGGFFRNWSSPQPNPSPNHLFVYTRRTLGRLVTDRGFQLLESKTTRRTVKMVARKISRATKVPSLPAENPGRMLAFHRIAKGAAFLTGGMNRSLNRMGIRRSFKQLRIEVSKKSTKQTRL